MKKLFSILAAAMVLAMVLAGCGSVTVTKKDDAAGDRLAQIKAKGQITIACEGTWAPWNYHDESDKLVGFDVEVGENIAKKLGVEPVFAEGEWDSILAGIESGRYDLMINGVDITEDRQKVYDFSEPYCYDTTALIVRTDNTDITTFEDLKGRTTCNSINSTYMLFAEDYGATVEGVDSLEETLNMVLAGRVDATLNSSLSFADYMSVHPDAELKIVATMDNPTEVAVPMPKGEDSDSLRAAVNQALKELREEGVLSELSIKYFGVDISNN